MAAFTKLVMCGSHRAPLGLSVLLCQTDPSQAFPSSQGPEGARGPSGHYDELQHGGRRGELQCKYKRATANNPCRRGLHDLKQLTFHIKRILSPGTCSQSACVTCVCVSVGEAVERLAQSMLGAAAGSSSGTKFHQLHSICKELPCTWEESRHFSLQAVDGHFLVLCFISSGPRALGVIRTRHIPAWGAQMNWDIW